VKRAIIYNLVLAALATVLLAAVAWPRRDPDINYHPDDTISTTVALGVLAAALVLMIVIGLADYFICRRLHWRPAYTCPVTAAALHIIIVFALIGVLALIMWDADQMEAFFDLLHLHVLAALIPAATFGPLNAVLIGRARRDAADPNAAGRTPAGDKP